MKNKAMFQKVLNALAANKKYPIIIDRASDETALMDLADKSLGLVLTADDEGTISLGVFVGIEKKVELCVINSHAMSLVDQLNEFILLRKTGPLVTIKIKGELKDLDQVKKIDKKNIKTFSFTLLTDNETIGLCIILNSGETIMASGPRTPFEDYIWELRGSGIDQATGIQKKSEPMNDVAGIEDNE